jgi:TPR repeat protein
MPLNVTLSLLASLVSAGSPASPVTALEARCAAGSAPACFEAGLRHDEGSPAQHPTQQNAARAAEFFERACVGGDMRGCNSAGVCHRRGHGVTRDPARALELTRRACDGKLAAGCFNLGAMLAEGDGNPRDPAEALRLFDSACTASYGPGCTASGATLLASTPQPSNAMTLRAQAYFKRGCGLRDGEGCYNLGQLSRQLDGSSSGALFAYRQACTFGVAAGCNWQGLMLHRGEGGATTPPTKKAKGQGVRLMERACQGGFHEGCFNAAIAYVKGDGVIKDHQAAGALFTRACEGGVAPACALLKRQKKSRPR